jgi:hypothetical protein
MESIPRIDPGLRPPTILGNGALIKFASDGGDVQKVVDFHAERVRQSSDDAASRLDLAFLRLIQQDRDGAYREQAAALALRQVFRVVGTRGEEVPTRRRVLALLAPGDFMNNAQIELLLDGSDIGLDVLYIQPGRPLPETMPGHDVLFCAVNESDENRPVLERLAGILPAWPRPVLNAPDKIARLTRDGVARTFADSRTICAPTAIRLTTSDLRRLAEGEIRLEDTISGLSFPVLVRPVGTHCGAGLKLIGGSAGLSAYVKTMQPGQDDFFLSSFVDYRRADGLFRKYRIVLIEKRPYLCHLAPSEGWKIHYVNVGMAESAPKREEEARAMETFDSDFAVRHAAALAELGEQIDLDYFGIDCAEMPDGRLLLFEVETAMVVHALDSPALYPYKVGQMRRVFGAFHAMIDRAASRPAGLKAG